MRPWFLVTAAFLAGCGSDASAGPRLTVTLHPHGSDGPARVREFRCESPAPSSDCERLRSVEPEAFAPVPDGHACTMVYGGPATATVEGRLGGAPVDARFSLRNGCEISRWQRLSWLLGAPPTA